MQRLANTFTRFDDADELSNDRLPGMPLVGFIAGTAVSLAMWGAVAALLAWTV